MNFQQRDLPLFYKSFVTEFITKHYVFGKVFRQFVVQNMQAFLFFVDGN